MYKNVILTILGISRVPVFSGLHSKYCSHICCSCNRRYGRRLHALETKSTININHKPTRPIFDILSHSFWSLKRLGKMEGKLGSNAPFTSGANLRLPILKRLTFAQLLNQVNDILAPDMHLLYHEIHHQNLGSSQAL